MKPRVDQRAIAELLGISNCTVTKVLNHDPAYRVSNETRELIIKTAREIGYEPRRRRTKNIAFVVCGALASVEWELLRYVCEEASTFRYRVTLVNIQNEPSFRAVSFSVNPLAVDGAIITGHLCPEMALQMSEILPVVTMGQFPDRSGVDWVKADNIAVGNQLTNQLISCGHKNIAVIVNGRDEKFSQQMIDGYQQAYSDAGFEPDLSMIWEKGYRRYLQLVQEIMSHDPRPTGLLAVTFMDHPIILTALDALGCRVPEDLSYVGWACNNLASLLPFPVISCLDNMCLVLAKVAVRRLMDRIENRSLPVEDIIVPMDIRKGETCIDIHR